MSYYLNKVITTKSRLYVWQYETPVWYGFKSNKERDNYTKSLCGDKRKDSVQRAQNNAKILVEANATPYTKFVTLTYKVPATSRQQCIKDFSNFARRFKRAYNVDLKFLHTQEQGKRNTKRWHIHAVLFHDFFIPVTDLKKIWNHGNVKIEAIDDFRNIGLYIVKYITKDLVKLNKKGYVSSMNLTKPTPQLLLEQYPIDSSLADYTVTWTRKIPNKETMEVNESKCTLMEFDLTK